MHAAVLALPQSRLNHRNIKAPQRLCRHGAHPLPGAAVVIRDINKADPERVSLIRGGRYYPAASESYRLILDGSSASADVFGHELGGLSPIDSVIGERKICFPHRYLLADLEKKYDFSVLALKEHGVPVRNLHVRADPHGLAPAVLAAHARQYVDVVRALLGAGKPCGNDSAVGKRQDS